MNDGVAGQAEFCVNCSADDFATWLDVSNRWRGLYCNRGQSDEAGQGWVTLSDRAGIPRIGFSWFRVRADRLKVYATCKPALPGEVRPPFEAILAEIAEAYPEAREGTKGAQAPTREKGQGRRRRGPGADILDACGDAMRDWLDRSKTLTEAAGLAGVDDQTVLRWIPEVLDIQDQGTQECWVRLIRAMKKEHYLGRYGERFREV